ncbi:MAG TPA: N-acetylmuramoyl-L-alanine amidase [Acidisoma sp.]|uniref:N-acetylmuramoyl-L-alanine amidase family protein n=1 Tax=Acidisoma sp. TaxID=1872115 RepID=UPI002CE46AFA|nr:N-acetylmuramoyl-L-alanine amidase [Acidisoma sp.]HTH99425.1 N-acetylmuramoyl-L-alanine amidase [Acidisoma sp.]
MTDETHDPHDRMNERRLLLSLGVSATVLIPAWLRPAIARAASKHELHQNRLLAKPRPAEAPLIMLDPGHGGKDPGAIGVAGTYEKHIALMAAHELKNRLEASGRYRVSMTRAKDLFIPLEDRVSIAQDRGAHLFVSMHADSIPDHSVRGASVYTLSSNASDKQTAILAQRENSSDRFAGPGFKGVTPAIARILASLVGRETRIGSARLQQDMVDHLANQTDLLTRPARHAAFVVLKSAEIPSVLVEMGFMSNYKDESALRQYAHRQRITLAMQNAVDAWYIAQKSARMAG